MPYPGGQIRGGLEAGRNRKITDNHTTCRNLGWNYEDASPHDARGNEAVNRGRREKWLMIRCRYKWAGDYIAELTKYTSDYVG